MPGILARAKGPTQKFPALRSTYYVLGGAGSSFEGPENYTILGSIFERKIKIL